MHQGPAMKSLGIGDLQERDGGRGAVRASIQDGKGGGGKRSSR